MEPTGCRLTVSGCVQGVGFRPFVWRLATRLGLTGRVWNDGGGVVIEVWGAPRGITTLKAALTAEAPRLAQVRSIIADAAPAAQPPDFRIIASAVATTDVEITPDTAPCADCLAEIADPGERRYRYAFTNCTQCGPRPTILTGLPWDRANTTMAGFALCPDCTREYQSPADRRFHAQPIACPRCGPQVWLETENGRDPGADPIRRAADLLAAGAIVAIKGVGGFHLACDAANAASVARLRQGKNRPDKPFALMVRNLAGARALCRVSPVEAETLGSPAAPIILLTARRALPGIAPGLNRFGVMLPSTPLHHLLLGAMDRPLVMTSGNRAGAPLITDNDAARRELDGLAHAWLMHDRPIALGLDDSVMRVDPAGPMIVRRARGIAPGSIAVDPGLASDSPVLAMGGDLKSAFCLLSGARATPSPHVGDLHHPDARNAWRALIDRWIDWHRVAPRTIAIDSHPDYASSLAGRDLAHDTGVRLISVQHHHAHFASCLAENVVPAEAEPILGIVLDGTGWGPDGTIWGGELLLGGYTDMRRVGRLRPVPLPGGDRAAREPWRNTLAHLVAAFGDGWREELAGSDLARALDTAQGARIEALIGNRLQTPLTSSAGRLFDAVAGALGFAGAQSHEGQAAMWLEAQAHGITAPPYPSDLTIENGLVQIDPSPLWPALLSDLRRGQHPGHIAARFHAGLATALCRTAAQIAGDTGARQVALSGGVMQNGLLANALHTGLQARGLEVLRQHRVPANDGGLSLGQAVVAAARVHQSARITDDR